MFLFYELSFFKKGDTIQGGTLFKEIRYLCINYSKLLIHESNQILAFNVIGYYAAGMEAIQVEGDVLFGLLKKVAPGLHKHLKKQGIEPILFMTEWFLCLFTRTLPWPCVMRIWDMFFFEGVKILFRVGLVLLKAALPKRVRSQCPSMFETLEALKGGLPPGNQITVVAFQPAHLPQGSFLTKNKMLRNIVLIFSI